MAVRFGDQQLLMSALMHARWMESEMRASIRQAKVDQYAEEMEAGDTFPYPVVFFDTKEQVYWIGDGFHRILATNKRGLEKLWVTLRPGGLFAAILWCIQANREQRGMDWQSGDKRKAILALLERPECAGWTGTRIAEAVGCTSTYVSRVRRNSGIEAPATIKGKDGKVYKRADNHPVPAAVAKRRERVADLYASGKSRAEISDLTELTTGQIDHDLKTMRKGGRVCECPTCEGAGRIEEDKLCPTCGGTGRQANIPGVCPRCRGSGRIDVLGQNREG